MALANAAVSALAMPAFTLAPAAKPEIVVLATVLAWPVVAMAELALAFAVVATLERNGLSAASGAPAAPAATVVTSPIAGLTIRLLSTVPPGPMLKE